MHGKGTVSGMMHHRHAGDEPVPGKYLAFLSRYRPVIFWNLTDRCNLNCTHCYSRSGPKNGADGELSTEEAIHFIDDLAEMKVPLILLTGGEPLLREDIWDLASHAERRGIMTALSTNGTLITPEIANRIKESGIGYAGISLDGAVAATHNRFRGSPDAFERTIAAFAHCRDAGIKTGVRVTLTKENYSELPSLIDLAEEIGATRFCLYWLVPTGRGLDAYNRLQLSGDEASAALTLLYERAKETDPKTMEFLTVDAPQDAIHLLASMKDDQAEDLAEAEELIASLHGGCSAGTKVANIDPRGNVYPCQFARSDELLVGNIREQPFRDIWDTDDNQVLTLFRRKPPLLTGRCGECNHKALCGGGCRIRALRICGDIHAEDPFCFLREGED
ncbi:radical SAM/SPASM domain-containing protein [Methanocalculus sp.]|uniref:radical SAM/SPASM domain-containing protein n=1 Tax=Methanocalculus sp. TaxID=2004547 RepID=UPI00271D2B8C|nr:radical SAM protein [Methanocalculus sp.]MDO8841548.1 radical SAM protein [Methanocalculus sp.]